MDLDQYQRYTDNTAVYRERVSDAAGRTLYAALGLAGEAGEVANEAKRIMSKDGMRIEPIRSMIIGEELGDVLWYCGALATELGMPLQKIASENLRKLEHRHAGR